jgi:hypothetical protein
MTPPAAPSGLHAAPVVRALFVPALWQVVATAAVILALMYVGMVWRPDLLLPTSDTGDPWNYLAAAERLRAGHPFTSIGPGDRPVIGFPRNFPLPLIAPPTVAVAWMPMLVFPPDPAMTLWAAGGFVSTMATVALLIMRGGIAIRILVAVLAIPLALTALSGNMNAYLVPVLLATWLGVRPSRRDGLLGGAAVGLATALRVGPALVGVLFVARRRWLAAGAAAVVLGSLVALSLLVAGTDAWTAYLQVSLGGSLKPTTLSVPGMLAAAGVAPAIARYGVVVVWIVVAAAVALLRARPRIAFVVAIVGAVYATPVVRFEFWALLVAAGAPWVLGDAAGEATAAAEAAVVTDAAATPVV